jgi:FtsH ternary system domain X7
MFLEFPKLDALQLALTSGAVPSEVAGAAAQVGVADDGRVFVSTAAKFRREEAARLKQLGVAGRKKSPVEMQRAVACWPEILPLRRDQAAFVTTEKTPVLFDLPDDGTLAEVVNEMLRLGNDRQSFRRFVADAASVGADAGSVRHGAESRVLLRVVGPPYYSLLRALDRETGDGEPRAFVERHPGVWVEAGYSHPLEDHLQPAPGKLLLLRPPHDWLQLDEAPFRDVYEVLEFDVPDSATRTPAASGSLRLKVPLRLVRGGTADVPELWVLRENAVERLESFVQSAADQLVARLSFAVGHVAEAASFHAEAGSIGHGSVGHGAETTVVLRLRPGRQPAPVLVLDAAAYCSYLKIPNLFVPAGRRLHPPLRRDVVKSLLADDAGQITWLAEDDGRFQPCSLPDSAFRPLDDWVEYVLDRHHAALDAWVQSTRFDFEPFICADDKPDKPKPKKESAKSAADPRRPKEPTDSATSPKKQGVIERMARRFQNRKPKQSAAKPQAAARKPSELERRLRELEESFLKLESPLDDPARRDLWREMARTNAELRHAADAGLCWTHVVWEVESEIDPDAASVRVAPLDDLDEWLETAVRHIPGISENPRDVVADPAIAEQYVVNALTDPSPSQAAVNAVAAWLVRCDATSPGANPFAAHMLELRQYLERHEPFLPIRTAWLAWLAFSRLSGGDELALARARDRLLERLFQHGLIPEHDLPGFLRAAGLRSGDRFRGVRRQVVELRELVQEWGDRFRGSMSAGTPTPAYIDLIFAFGFARLGEPGRCKELLKSAGETLRKDFIHHWLFAAFEHRLGEALKGRPPVDSLPRDLLEEAELMDRMDRYKIDRLREHSQLLEPHERIEPYRRWHGCHADELSRMLDGLSDVLDRADLAKRLGTLLAEQRPDAQRTRIVATSLELAPRLGEAVAEGILKYVPPLLDRLNDPLEQALLLEKALLLAANYDRKSDVLNFVERMHQLLLAQKDAGTAVIQPFESLLAESMRGMRKLGMREHMSRLLATMDGIVESLRQRQPKRPANDKTPDELLKLRLQIAAGWFYFGHDASAWPILDAVRDILLRNDLIPNHQTKLACAYIAALGQAPVEQALERYRELFSGLRGVTDSFTTNSHYSLSQLDVVEALVLAIASDDFTPDKAGRRWMDDDEFLIRRRIHRDVRAALA